MSMQGFLPNSPAVLNLGVQSSPYTLSTLSGGNNPAAMLPASYSSSYLPSSASSFAPISAGSNLPSFLLPGVIQT